MKLLIIGAGGVGTSAAKIIQLAGKEGDWAEKVVVSDYNYERAKEVAGRKVQRDLYSAYLLKNADKEYRKPDRGKCIEGYEKFLRMQEEAIERMKEQGISKKYCYGC